MKHLFTLLLAACPLAAAAQLEDYRYFAPVELDGEASHYRFALPAPVYRGTARRDMGDIRVFNAMGEAVPHAFLPRDEKPDPPKLQAAPIFPLYGDGAKGIDAAAIRVERTPSGTVVNASVSGAPPAARRALLGYLVDATAVKEAPQGLVLDWRPADGLSGRVRVEGSDDLKSWRTLATDAPLLRLEHRGARLEQRRVALASSRARYLRLSFAGVPRGFTLTRVELELSAGKREPAREWISLTAQQGEDRDELLFDPQGRFPVDRVRLRLPESNTVARVEISVRERAGDKWRAVAAATAYRLSREGGEEIVSPDIVVPLTRERHWRVKVDRRGGGLGNGPPQMELGWVPHEIVFVARGAAPFTFAYGKPEAASEALPLAVVLPVKDDQELVQARRAAIGGISGRTESGPSLFKEPRRFLRRLGEDHAVRNWVLWSALVIGVLLVAAMALRLLRNMGSD